VESMEKGVRLSHTSHIATATTTKIKLIIILPFG